MLRDPTNKIVGDADVKRASDTTGQDVDVEAACPHRTALWNTGRPVKSGDDSLARCAFVLPLARPTLFPRLQLAGKRKQLGRIALDDARDLGRRLALAEIQFLDPSRSLVDLVGGNQDLPDILVGVAEMLLQFQYAVAQPSKIVAEVEHFGADLVGGVAHSRVFQ